MKSVKNYLRISGRYFRRVSGNPPKTSRKRQNTPRILQDCNIPDTELAIIPPDWPGRDTSRIIPVQDLRWHVQRTGSGPTLLLVHGTGGSTHSWATAVPELATSHDVVVVDLPGHGFTRPANGAVRSDLQYSLHGMSNALSALLHHLGIQPVRVAGHSAGVPILMQLALDGHIAPTRIIGFNPALVPPPAFYTTLLAPLVGLLVERDVVAEGGAWLARATDVVQLMLSSSGTVLPDAQLARYRRLCEQPSHVHAALTMMSRWDLPQLLRDARALHVPLELIGGTRDRWVPPQALARVVDGMPMARFDTVDAGHLIPDERPDVVVERLSTR